MAMAYSRFVVKDPGGKTFADRLDLGDGEKIQPTEVLGDNYCIPADIDVANHRIVLAESSPDIDLTRYAFLAQAHAEVTRRFLCIDFDELETLMPKLPVARRLIFIANCARTGSTLLQKMLNEVDDVAALGEPNFILACRLLREFSAAEADGFDVNTLLSACMSGGSRLLADRSGLSSSKSQWRSDVIDEHRDQNTPIQPFLGFIAYPV